MTIAECLSSADVEYLYEVLSNLEIEAVSHSKAYLVNQIQKKLRDLDQLKAIYYKLDAESKIALWFLVFLDRTADSPVKKNYFRITELAKKSDKKVEKIIQKLYFYGLIYPMDREGKRTDSFCEYDIPADLRPLLVKILQDSISVFFANSKKISDLNVRPIISSASFIRDIFNVLSFVRREKPPLRRPKHSFYKKAIKTLESYLEVKEQLDKVSLHNGETKFYSNRFSRLEMILRYCYFSKLIEVRNYTLLTTERISHWLKLTYKEKWESVYNFWLSDCIGASLPLNLILVFMINAPANQWISETSLINAAESIFAGSTIFRKEDYQSALHNLIEQLYYLGLVNVGKEGGKASEDIFFLLTEEGKIFLSFTEPGLKLEPSYPSQISIAVQPTFEIIVPLEIDLTYRWELEKFTEHVKTEKIVTLKLTKNSVYRALDEGASFDSLLQLLSSRVSSPLPQNVLYTLHDWYREYERITIQPVYLLNCDSSTLAKELLSLKSVKSFILGQLSETQLIVNGTQLTKLLKTLRKLGYHPKIKQ